MRGGQGHLNHLKVERLSAGVTIDTTRQIFILHSLLSHPERTMQHNEPVFLPKFELCCSKSLWWLYELLYSVYHSTVQFHSGPVWKWRRTIHGVFAFLRMHGSLTSYTLILQCDVSTLSSFSRSTLSCSQVSGINYACLPCNDFSWRPLTLVQWVYISQLLGKFYQRNG